MKEGSCNNANTILVLTSDFLLPKLTDYSRFSFLPHAACWSFWQEVG